MANVTLTDTEKAEIFEAALNGRYVWRTVSGIERTEVDVKGTSYVVEIHNPRKYLAAITWASAWGNADHVVGGSATTAQHHKVVAAMRTNRAWSSPAASM